MATPVRVSCINKSDRQNPHERITHIGGVNADGTRWKMTEDAAIAAIKAGKFTFYVTYRDRLGNEHTVNVVIATHLGREYLKTEADGLKPDNLLALPECP